MSHRLHLNLHSGHCLDWAQHVAATIFLSIAPSDTIQHRNSGSVICDPQNETRKALKGCLVWAAYCCVYVY